MTTPNITKFKRLQNSFSRIVNSELYKYWQAHEEETSNGWGFKRMFPYKKSAEAAYKRYMELEQAIDDLYEASSEEEKAAMQGLDRHWLLDDK